jgi:hypothetical protein
MPRAQSPLAPAACQRCSSSKKDCRASWRLGADPSKAQAFRCFKRIWAPRMISELNPFLCCLGIFLQDFYHQSAKEVVLRLGTSATRFRDCRIANQNCVANTQAVRMCWTVSCAWSQRGQRFGWGSPLFCNRSAVQQWSRIANHRKVLHFSGAYDFHNRFHGSKVVDQRNKLGRQIWLRRCLRIRASSDEHPPKH